MIYTIIFIWILIMPKFSFGTLSYSHYVDTVTVNIGSQIVNEKLVIANLGKLSHILMLNKWRIDIAKNVHDFDGYLIIKMKRKDYSSDTIIKASTHWVDGKSIQDKEKCSFEYDRFITDWIIRNIYFMELSWDGYDHSLTDSVIYKTLNGQYKLDRESNIFIKDKRYRIDVDSLFNNNVFYSLPNENSITSLYKCRFKAVVMNYNFYTGETFRVLMPVSEALEFRPATESEAEAMGYEKVNVVLILK